MITTAASRTQDAPGKEPLAAMNMNAAIRGRAMDNRPYCLRRCHSDLHTAPQRMGWHKRYTVVP